MARLRTAILVLAVSLAAPVVWASSAFAVRNLTVTPSIGLVELDTVTIEGTGFNPSVDVGFCQGIDDGSPEPSDCAAPSGSSTRPPRVDSRRSRRPTFHARSQPRPDGRLCVRGLRDRVPPRSVISRVR
jgi:hypothetical protein